MPNEPLFNAPQVPSPDRVFAPAAPAAPVSLRILVVDDNHDAAATLAMLLEFTGHTTRTAHDGLQALAVAEEFEPDVALLDIGLPLLTGHEVGRRLRQGPRGDRTMLVALTGWGQQLDRQASQEAGFDAHFVKPVDHTVLLGRIEHWAAQRAEGAAGMQNTKGRAANAG